MKHWIQTGDFYYYQWYKPQYGRSVPYRLVMFDEIVWC